MTIMLDDLGDGYPTFPQFQVMLREYERDLELAEKRKTDDEKQQAAFAVMRDAANQTYEANYQRARDQYNAAYVRYARPHRIGGEEELGKIHHCGVCGKYFDGGVGAVCDG